jgi:hypothetical protein
MYQHLILDKPLVRVFNVYTLNMEAPMDKTVHIEKHEGRPAHQPLYWLREEGETLPYAYVERVGSQWWLGGMPGCCGYFKTRNAAIAEAV